MIGMQAAEREDREVWHSPFRRKFCVYGGETGLGVYEAFVFVVVVVGRIVVCDDTRAAGAGGACARISV